MLVLLPIFLVPIHRYNFICERWFARDKEDGMIDRVVPVALEEDVKTFEKLFQEHARVGITDSHLWLSCLKRPDRSTFTRTQRVSCCVALLLLTMMTSALFYQPEDNETGESTSECFGFKSCARLFTGLFCCCCCWWCCFALVFVSFASLMYFLI